MATRVLYEVSRSLCTVIENGLRERVGRPVPVLFSHPLDPAEDESLQGLFGVLYLTSVVPDPHFRQAGFDAAAPRPAGFDEQLRRAPLWVRARFVFLLAGGDIEEQLVALGGALQTLYDHPTGRLSAADLEPDSALRRSEAESEEYILRLLDRGDGWSELGLPEHRLSISFEVTCAIRSTHVELVARTEERSVDFEVEP